MTSLTDNLMERGVELGKEYNNGNLSFGGLIGQSVKEGIAIGGGECSLRYFSFSMLQSVTGLALFIISCIGAAGHFPGGAFGWSLVGLTGGSYIFHLLKQNPAKNKTQTVLATITMLAGVALGFCGGLHLLSNRIIGGALIGTLIASSVLQYAIVNYMRKKQLEAI